MMKQVSEFAYLTGIFFFGHQDSLFLQVSILGLLERD